VPTFRRVLAGPLLALVLLAAGQDAHASTASRAVSIARSELAKGVKEIPDGSNKGGRIRMYGGSTSPRFYPAPWCAYFVSWVARRSGRPLGPSGQGFGYVPYIRAWAGRTGRWKKTPRSGDLIMFPQHVGLVERVYRNGTLTTIEGNSSNRVARRWRRWRDASGYVRWAAGGTVSKGSTPKPKAPAKKPRQPLVARISVYPSGTVAVRQAVGFSANDSSGDIARYAWDLDGDGKFDDARGDNAERAYTKAGTVRVGLRITGRNGKTSVARKAIVVHDNQSPVAALELPAEARVGEKVRADASGSRDPDGKIEHYEWDLDGDGVWEEDDEHRSITFRRPGVHTVSLRVIDDRGAMNEIVKTVRVTARPPVAKASAPSRVAVGREVTLDASRSSSPEGAGLTYQWLVDGATVEGRYAGWRFATPGTREVRLVVVDEWGARAETAVKVDVVNEAPDARVGLPSRVIAGEWFTLDGAASVDPDSRIVRWEWDIDDDGTWDATGARPALLFDRSGSREVRLRVVDEFGGVDTRSVWIGVMARPVARIGLVYPSPLAGASIAFTASGTSDADGDVRRLDWDLDGDGRTDHTTWSVNTRVWWTYATAGNRTASVTVTDSDGLQTKASLVVGVR
jgi:PKD repeat protein